MKKRGFTLIELLAVIVVLGITALIATPMVLNTIQEARKGAARSSASSYIDAIETRVASGLIRNEKYENKEDYTYDEIAVDMKGTTPTGGIYSLENGIVKEGVFCINGYEVNYKDNKTTVGEKCTGEDVKLNGGITLLETSGYYNFLESKEIEIKDNVSGGALTCISSDETIATCSITGTIVTVVAGEKLGSATLTIKSEGSSKYKEATAAYVVHTELGILSYKANNYTGVYDGKEHSIAVSGENLVIKYGLEEGNYTLTENPTFVNTGEYIVYYEITKAGYQTVTGSKTVTITKAEGKLNLKEKTGTVEYDKVVEVEITENTNQSKIDTVVASPDIAEASIVDGKLNIKGLSTGTTTVTLISEETNNYTSASVEYTVTVVKTNNTLTLSSNSGIYTYPDGGTFEITENKSGGTLSCETSDKEVADCSIEGTTVTVTLGTKTGDAKLTIMSAATKNYNTGQAVYVVTTGKGLLSYTANDYTGVYDGEEHGITVTSSGATIKYGLEEGTYNYTKSPTRITVGTLTVYYEVTKAGYQTVTGSRLVTITKANGSVTAPTSKTLTYNGSEQALVNAGSSTTGTVQYKLEGGTYSTIIPTAKMPGTYTVYYKVFGDANHNDTEEKSVKTTIAKATLNYTTGSYSGVYDGKLHGITVLSEGATIKYGTTSGTYNLDANPTYSDVGEYTVYFEISREGYITVTGSEKVVITKANNTLTLSTNSATYKYPDSGTFDITANTSGGTLSCTSSNEAVATCSITNNVVTVTPGTTEGDATLTIKSEATKNYNAGQVAHVATTTPGLMSVTANDYTGVYDGEEHGITVTSSGATIKYGLEEGTYNYTKSPTRITVGTLTVYYEVTKAGYKTVTGSRVVTITKADGTVAAPTTKTITYTGSAQNLVNAGSSNTGTVQYKLEGGTYSTSIPTGTNAGTYKVYYKVVGDANHNDVAEAGPITVTINKAAGSVTAPTAKSLTYTGESQVLVNAGSSNTGTIQYKLGSTGTYGASIPTGTDAGNYIVYYKVIGDSNHNDVAEKSVTVTINKANNTLTLSSNAATYTYPDSGTFTITKNTSEGKLGCSTSVSGIAGCSITCAEGDPGITVQTGISSVYKYCLKSGATVKVTPYSQYASTAETTVIITSEETANYNSATASHIATTKKGKLSITANGYEGMYDGNAHGITVTSSGATIKYGTSEGTYNLTSSPTYTDPGTYTVYYQVSRTGYETVTGSKQVTITKGTLSITANGYEGMYDGNAHGITVISSGATIKYGTSSGTYNLTSSPTYTNAGTYTVYYQVTRTGYETVTGSKQVKITALSATNVSYTNSSLSGVTTLQGALKYLEEKLK